MPAVRSTLRRRDTEATDAVVIADARRQRPAALQGIRRKLKRDAVELRLPWCGHCPARPNAYGHNTCRIFSEALRGARAAGKCGTSFTTSSGVKMHRPQGAKSVFSLAVLLVLPFVAHGQSLLVSNNLGSYVQNMYGGNRWDEMTGFLNTAFSDNVTTTGQVEDGTYLLGFDRLWVDQRLSGPDLSAAEIAAITEFAATGRRVVLIGENNFWATWNNTLASLVGGTIVGPDCVDAPTSAVVMSELTAGAATVNERCGQAMSGGTSLYEREVVSLWGANQNILVWLDSNMQEDLYLDLDDNRQFAQNVATWLASGTEVVVPEPGTYALVALGLGVLVLVRRRRRTEV